MKQQPIRHRLLAPFLVLAAVWTTVAPALLDAGEETIGAAVEAEHDPATCAVLHDHAACIQLATSSADVPPMSEAIPGPGRIAGFDGLGHAKTPPARTHLAAPSPRGPPLTLD
jgi:hypothetical protein